MDIIPLTNSSKIEAFDFNSYGLIELKKRYSSLRSDLKKSLNVYTTPLLQAELIQFHEELWCEITRMKKEDLLDNSFEDLLTNLFVFNDEELNPSIDFLTLLDLKNKIYLLKPAKKILESYLNIIEKYRFPLLGETSLSTDNTYKWEGLRPHRIDLTVES
ncbi:MAG: hypothetical protein ACMG57_01705 [Candidatus Dojkabacteria bacterium]